MKARSFSLQPFPPTGCTPLVKINGIIGRRGETLAIRYALYGYLPALTIPLPAQTPTRSHGLWQETCFEFFLAVKDSPRYWEFNLSPAGHWNVYRFRAYRQGMAAETAFTSLPMRLRRQADYLLLALEVDLGKIVPADQALELGLSAVIKARVGQVTYWALTHPGPQADFHRRDSFIMEVPGKSPVPADMAG
jgi:hypothetical protein